MRRQLQALLFLAACFCMALVSAGARTGGVALLTTEMGAQAAEEQPSASFVSPATPYFFFATVLIEPQSSRTGEGGTVPACPSPALRTAESGLFSFPPLPPGWRGMRMPSPPAAKDYYVVALRHIVV